MENKRFKGRIERWNDTRGFGFVRPENKARDVFIHISAFKGNSARRPKAGDQISYQLQVGRDGRTTAINAEINGAIAEKAGVRQLAEGKKIYRLSWLFALLLLIVGSSSFMYGREATDQQASEIDAVAISSDNGLEAQGGSDFSLNGDREIQAAFEKGESDIQVAGFGIVAKLLPDDEEGSRHQRFIVRLDSGHTLLIAHNIDLASRIDALSTGDKIAFYGEYEWNRRGGVIHWTHHDPRGEHVGGWLKHGGEIYQ